MKLMPAAIVCSLLCALSSPVRADEESDRAALRMIRTNYMQAANSGDPSKIAPFLSKDVTGVMVTGEEIKGLDGLDAYWKRIQNLIGPGGGYRVTVNVDKTDLYGDIAVSHGNTDDVVRLGTGKELQFHSLWTAVCHKEGGVWKVVRMEAAMDPVDNIFVSLKIQKTRLIAGACGLAVGIALSIAVGLLMRRRSSTPRPP
jgi:ketosteroid isomerase-like protein